MSFASIQIKDSSDLSIFCPENLSHNLILKIESNVTNAHIEEFSASASSLLICATFFGMISWIILEIIVKLWIVKIDNKLVFSFTHTKCRSCQFYAKNSYLRCAVHPSIVLTKQADNCLDYCHKHK